LQWYILVIKNFMSTIGQKLKIKEGNSILAINAPSDYKKSLGPLPAGTKMTDSGKAFDRYTGL
jgi:hypothetical protein